MVIRQSDSIACLLAMGGGTKYVHIKSTTVYAPRRNWDSRQRVFPTPQKQGGGGTLACGWGVGGSPNSDEGRTLWYSLYVRTLWSHFMRWGRYGVLFLYISLSIHLLLAYAVSADNLTYS